MKRWIAALLLMGCSAGRSYVKVNDVALGRIVVYRNGVAYFQRYAHLAPGQRQLRVVVPADRVDDFLKSLTVVDRKTGAPMSVSFPHREQATGGQVEMAVELPSDASGDLTLTYVTDSPSWKPSYRVEVEDDGKVLLQGWAIVDNTSAEDWKDVILGVGSTSAMSFRHDLWSIRTVERQTLAGEEVLGRAPPTGGSPYAQEPQQAVVVSTFGDEDLRESTGSQESGTESITITNRAPTIDAGSSKQGTTVEQDYLTKVPQRGRTYEAAIGAAAGEQGTFRIEGFAAPGEADPQATSRDRANRLRDVLVARGASPAKLMVVGRGLVAGQPPGARLVRLQTEERQVQAPAATTDRPVGESHFSSGKPITVPHSSSVMLSTVRAMTDGRVVYYYDPESPRGDARFAFRAVRFVNPTDSTLDTGPLTVYGAGRFVGEGMAEPIGPGATAVVPFALDRQIVVERTEASEDRIAAPVSLENGRLMADMLHVSRIKLTLTNRLDKPATVYLRRTVPSGWTLLERPGREERLGDAHLFAVEVDAGKTREVTLAESIPVREELDLRSVLGRDLVRAYVSLEGTAPPLADELRALLALHTVLLEDTRRLESVRARLKELRVRLGELKDQVVSLQEIKAKGELMTHLSRKMKDVSERVHQATLEEITLREKVALGELRFRDAMAETSLAKR